MNNTTKLNWEMLKRMEQKIFAHRPQLKNIKELYGSVSYFDYTRQRTRVNLHKPFSERKHEITEAIRSETDRLLGTAVGAEVDRQLKKNDSVSTAEHSGPLGTGNTLDASLQYATSMFGNSDPRFRNVIILACSGVSFNNVLSFSRGLQFHLFPNNQVLDSTITFFGRSADVETVMYSPAYTIETINEIKKKLDVLLREGSLSLTIQEKIVSLLDSIYSSQHVLTGADYLDQLTISNYYFWKKLFPTYKDDQIPNYVMLSQEKIVLNLLLKFHLDQETPIHHFLFESKYHELIERYFDGITGAFNNEGNSGTFLFWGVSKKDNTRFQLFREGKYLVNKDKTFSLLLSPETLREAIANKDIFPGLFLTFTVLSFYYGLLLRGGPSQTSYLTKMKKAYIAMMKEAGDSESEKDAEQSITDDFVFSRHHLSFLDVFGERIAATGLDMYLYQEPTTWQKIINATRSITMEEFLTLIIPNLYKQIPFEEKEEELTLVTRPDVENFIGLDKKIPPISTIL